MGSLGVPELLIILAVVVLIFGVGRISKIGGELGKGIKAFREGVNEAKEDTTGDNEPAEKIPEAESEPKA